MSDLSFIKHEEAEYWLNEIKGRLSVNDISLFESNIPGVYKKGYTNVEMQEWRSHQFVAVDLSAGAKTNFVALGDYYPEIEIYDVDGYRQLSWEGSNSKYGEDSIINYVPNYNGTHYVSVNWEYLTFAKGDVGIYVYQNEEGGTEHRWHGDAFKTKRLASEEDVKPIARLYSAAFDRDPDAAGLNYWINQWERGLNLLDISNSFINSQEFIDLYGDVNQMSNQSYIDILYQNVLDRPSDSAGFDYWENELNNGLIDNSGILASFSESTENQNKVEAMFSNLHYSGGGDWFL